MEDSLTMNELNLLLGTIRQQKKESNVFAASLKGIDLEKYYNNPVETKRREIEKRAAERRLGAVEYERQQLAEIGIDFGVIDVVEETE